MSNIAIMAAAGSGKTTLLISEAAALTSAKILITTYTIENTEQIRTCVIEKFGFVPPHITIMTWYSALLAHGVRPYQNTVSTRGTATSIAFVDLSEGIRRTPRASVDRYYFTNGNQIYRDRVSDFVCFVDDRSGGLVIRRLEGIYTHVFIDEVQDLSGHDLDLLEKLFRSNISIIVTGDPRQATYTTTNSSKHKAHKRAAIVQWLEGKEEKGLLQIEPRVESWRCNQAICDFADALYPHWEKTASKNSVVTGHDGIFQITADEVSNYVSMYKPTILRWSKTANTLGFSAFNFGAVKGKTFDRVLIFPTQPMKKYLKDKNPDSAGDRSKFYVAVTRARFSVAFVV